MKMLATTLAFGVALVSPVTRQVHAADIVLGVDLGDKVKGQIKKTSSDPAAHQIKYGAKDSEVVFTPGGGATDDPPTNGAAAVIFSASDCQCLTLAPTPTVVPGWTPSPASGTPTKYKWKDAATGSTAQVRGGKIKFKKKGGITYGLDASPQGEVEVQITFGDSADTFCTRFAAPLPNNDTATKYKANVALSAFTACSPVPGICPCAPTTTTTELPTTTTSTTTTTQTTVAPTTTTSTTTSTTTTLPPPLDHFRWYDASALNSTTVTITDQWIPPMAVGIGPAAAFLVPVEKDDPIIDPFTHLTAYLEYPPPPFVPLSVDIDNQFGPQTLTVYAPTLLLVPTEKFPAGPGPLPPLPRDHFQCYTAFGPSLGVPKVLTDQFSGPDPVTVLDPFLFCNPASKDGSPILGPPPEHLTCYSYTPPGSAVGPIPFKNQFTEPGVASIDVFAADALCVPSLKLGFGPTTTTTVTTTSTTAAPTTTTVPGCGGATVPLCDGRCPLGRMCVDFGGFCSCAGATGPCGTAAGPPLCYGECPPLSACVHMGGTCVCVP
jgi:hypothetical protein